VTIVCVALSQLSSAVSAPHHRWSQVASGWQDKRVARPAHSSLVSLNWLGWVREWAKGGGKGVLHFGTKTKLSPPSTSPHEPLASAVPPLLAAQQARVLVQHCWSSSLQLLEKVLEEDSTATTRTRGSCCLRPTQHSKKALSRVFSGYLAG